jgi:hypothetical protein
MKTPNFTGLWLELELKCKFIFAYMLNSRKLIIMLLAPAAKKQLNRWSGEGALILLMCES